MGTDFGCGRCYGDDAGRALAWYRGDNGLEHRGYLVDGSHVIVSLLVCRQCGQPFVSVFTELVQWRGGDGTQHSHILPVTAQEAADLAAQGDDLDLDQVGSFGADRRRLTGDWPGGPGTSARWAEGPFSVRTGR